MKILKSISLVLLLLVAYGTGASAQKLGHLDAQTLLANMSATQAANKKLETFSKQKQQQLEVKGKEVTDFYVKTMQDIQAGKLSPVQQQEAEVTLQRKKQDLQKLEFTIQQDILKEQERLFQPIVDKVNAAIKKVGESNGYDYIFDSGTGILVHTKDSEDVTSLVKKELGL